MNIELELLLDELAKEEQEYQVYKKIRKREKALRHEKQSKKNNLIKMIFINIIILSFIIILFFSPVILDGDATMAMILIPVLLYSLFLMNKKEAT